MHATRRLLALIPIFAASITLAQAPAIPTPGAATLTGRVICADTNGPARFAKVMLKSATPGPQGDDIFSAMGAITDGLDSKAANAKKPTQTPEVLAQQTEQRAAMSKLMSAMSDMLYSATVAIDGTYTFHGVKPGTYYVHATAAGYIDPVADLAPDDLTSTDPAVRKRVAAIATPIIITGTESARADLRLERGASVTGRVAYDDGSPAVGWTVKPVRPVAPGPNPFAAMGVDASDIDLAHLTEMSVTDDTGRFHIPGLAPGDYNLQARLVTATLGTNANNPMGNGAGSGGIGSAGGIMGDRMGLRLTVYTGNALRLADAKPISLRAGEDRNGVDITMPLRALHSVSGHVISKADAHPVNSGSVELTAQDANGKDDPSLHLMASIKPDGSFHFDYVPGPATFTVKASGVKDMSPAKPKTPKPSAGDKADDADEVESLRMLTALGGGERTASRTYGPASTTILLSGSDIDSITLAVAELPPAK